MSKIWLLLNYFNKAILEQKKKTQEVGIYFEFLKKKLPAFVYENSFLKNIYINNLLIKWTLWQNSQNPQKMRISLQ